MTTSDMTYDLDNIATSRDTFLLKFKAQISRWTPSDSLGAEIAFNMATEMLREMSMTFKENNLFSMKIRNGIEIVDGKYRFDKTNNDLLLMDKSDTLRYKVLSISDSNLVLIMTDDKQQPVITFKKQP
jgi:hypothetical protein